MSRFTAATWYTRSQSLPTQMLATGLAVRTTKRRLPVADHLIRERAGGAKAELEPSIGSLRHK
jgi:hypothetical protein